MQQFLWASANKILMQEDVGILSIPYNQIELFYDSLIEFYEKNDTNILKNFLRSNALLFTEHGRNLK